MVNFSDRSSLDVRRFPVDGIVKRRYIASAVRLVLATITLRHVACVQAGLRTTPTKPILQILQSSKSHTYFVHHLISSIHPSITRWLNESNSFLNFTVFAPSNSAYLQLNKSGQTGRVWRANDATRKEIARLHLILTEIDLSTFDFPASTLQGWTVRPIEEPPTSSVELNGTSIKTTIRESLAATNGIIYFTQPVLVFPHGLRNASLVNVFDTLRIHYHPEFKHFTRALVNFGIDVQLSNRSERFTLFAVSDSVLENQIHSRWNMSLENLWKSQPEHRGIGASIVSFILPKLVSKGKYVDADLLKLMKKGQPLRTFDSNFKPEISVTSEGAIRVGQVVLVRTNVQASNGVIHFVSAVPAPTKATVPNFCSEDAQAKSDKPSRSQQAKQEVFKGSCVICRPSLKLSCVPGRLAGNNREECCPYHNRDCKGGTKYCRSTQCVHKSTPTKDTVPRAAQGCCSGYFGQRCSQCPGPLLLPCNGHGQCSDGLGGNGTCRCDHGFSGAACNISTCASGENCGSDTAGAPPSAPVQEHSGCPGCPHYCTLAPGGKLLCDDKVPDDYFDVPVKCHPRDVATAHGCVRPSYDPFAKKPGHAHKGNAKEGNKKDKDDRYLIPLGITAALAAVIIVLVILLLKKRIWSSPTPNVASIIPVENSHQLEILSRVPATNIYVITEGDSTPSSGEFDTNIPYVKMPGDQQQKQAETIPVQPSKASQTLQSATISRGEASQTPQSISTSADDPSQTPQSTSTCTDDSSQRAQSTSRSAGEPSQTSQLTTTSFCEASQTQQAATMRAEESVQTTAASRADSSQTP